MILSCNVLPESLNIEIDEEQTLLRKQSETIEQKEILEGCNLLSYEEINLGTILKDSICLMSLFSCFFTMASVEFYVSFLSLHLTDLGFVESQMGFWFTLSGLLYLPMCLAVPVMFTTTPPRLQIVFAFFVNAFCIAMMGPSNILGMSDSYLIISLGIFL